VLDRKHPIVIIAESGRENELAIRLGRIGFDHVAGYLQDGLRSLELWPELTVTTNRLSAQFAAELLSSRQPPLAIDGRAPRQREQKYTAGSLGIPLLRTCWNATDLTASVKLPVALRAGKPQTCWSRLPKLCRRPNQVTLTFIVPGSRSVTVVLNWTAC
jgi:hypothetical protein